MPPLSRPTDDDEVAALVGDFPATIADLFDGDLVAVEVLQATVDGEQGHDQSALCFDVHHGELDASASPLDLLENHATPVSCGSLPLEIVSEAGEGGHGVGEFVQGGGLVVLHDDDPCLAGLAGPVQLEVGQSDLGVNSVGIAHQKLIRDARAAEDADADLFGRWWEQIDLSLANSVVREIDYVTARGVIDKYEWLGTMPAVVWHCFGIFFDGCLGGVVTYGPEYIENLGQWDRYGYTGKIICLSRGACTHWSPAGSASRLIRKSMALLPDRFEVITATTDHEAGEVGTIYQACGFIHVRMNPATRWGAIGFRSRTLWQRWRIRKKSDMVARGLIPVKEHQKGRYFAFRGGKGAKRRHHRAIAHLIQPYPKRAACREDELVPASASAVQPCEAAPSPEEALL